MAKQIEFEKKTTMVNGECQQNYPRTNNIAIMKQKIANIKNQKKKKMPNQKKVYGIQKKKTEELFGITHNDDNHDDDGDDYNGFINRRINILPFFFSIIIILMIMTAKKLLSLA